jgi:hypothetical protein
MTKDDINKIADHTIAIIKHTLENPQFDGPCKRMATGLF